MKSLREFLKENINVINEAIEKDLRKNRAVKIIDLNNKMEFAKKIVGTWQKMADRYEGDLEINDFSDDILEKELGFVPDEDYPEFTEDEEEKIDRFLERKENELKDYLMSLKDTIKKTKKDLKQELSKYDFNDSKTHFDFFVALFSNEGMADDRKYFRRDKELQGKYYEIVVDEILNNIEQFEDMDIEDFYVYIEMVTASEPVMRYVKTEIKHTIELIQKNVKDNSRKFYNTNPVGDYDQDEMIKNRIYPEEIFGRKDYF